MDALRHTDQPQSSIPHCRLHAEAHPGVTDLQPDLFLGAAQIHRELVHAAMFHGILQGFLRHSEQAEGDVPGQMIGNFLPA